MLIIKASLFASRQQLKQHNERKMGWDFFLFVANITGSLEARFNYPVSKW